LLFFSCNVVDLINDYVPPTPRISNAVEELPIDPSFDLRASYFNNVGELIEEAAIQWVSLNPEIISIESNEMAFRIGKKWGVSATLTLPLFGKVVFKAPNYSGGIFFNL
jgi:hypothetical protein